jgi:acyl-coenzyme A thioesterase PaaI-like protein
VSDGSPAAPRRSTYPPPDQVLSALGLEIDWVDEDTMLGRAVVGPELLSRGSGPCGVGALVPIVDLLAGVRATPLAEGDWLATSDVWLHEIAPLDRGPITVTTELLRAGRRTIISRHEVCADGRPVVASTVEFTRIRREASAHQTVQTRTPSGWTRIGSGDLLDRRLEEACGFERIEPGTGVVELPRSPFVANSTGTLQGGVVALLADVAAADAVGPGARTVDLQYRFLAPTGDGPARASVRPLRVDGDLHTVAVDVVDRSNGRLVGVAVCGVRPG